MLLSIDIGNTNTVFGVFQDDALIKDWRITSRRQTTEDEIAVFLRMHLSADRDLLSLIRAVGIASVVPELTGYYERMAKKYLACEPYVVSSSLPLGITIHYSDPALVGADRLCNAVAGFAKYGGPLIIVDFGTATTFDVVGKNGDYLGGVIAPGIETASAELHRRAAKLPRVELSLPRTVIGTDTISSMQSGIIYSALDGTEGIVNRIKEELTHREKSSAKVIATGGFSTILHNITHFIDGVEPTLVLDGIRLIGKKINRI